ncbi:hypothetical protein OROMI_028272 [Orobanche minor]
MNMLHDMHIGRDSVTKYQQKRFRFSHNQYIFLHRSKRRNGITINTNEEDSEYKLQKLRHRPPKAQSTLATALFGKIVKDMDIVYELSDRQKAVVSCMQVGHAQDFLLAIPIEGLVQKMSPVEYRTIFKYRLMIPIYPCDTRCPACITGCLDTYGEHAVHCKVDPGFKHRHDHVRDTLYDVLWRAGISAKKESGKQH